MEKLGTKFSSVYSKFFSKITDDMYMELTVDETRAMVKELLLNALPYFEFPRQDINDYNEELACFGVELTNEEMNIIAIYMVVTWIDQQLASVENTRMKYSGSDFKFTSQANHLSKLITMKKEYIQEGFHLQRLYKRRKTDDKGVVKSTISSIMFPEEG
jgi:hypothetical protein